MYLKYTWFLLEIRIAVEKILFWGSRDLDSKYNSVMNYASPLAN